MKMMRTDDSVSAAASYLLNKHKEGIDLLI